MHAESRDCQAVPKKMLSSKHIKLNKALLYVDQYFYLFNNILQTAFPVQAREVTLNISNIFKLCDIGTC